MSKLAGAKGGRTNTPVFEWFTTIDLCISGDCGNDRASNSSFSLFEEESRLIGFRARFDADRAKRNDDRIFPISPPSLFFLRFRISVRSCATPPPPPVRLSSLAARTRSLGRGLEIWEESTLPSAVSASAAEIERHQPHYTKTKADS